MDITLLPAKNSLVFKKIKSKSELKEGKEIAGYLIDSDEKEIRRIIDALKAKKKKILLAVQGKDDIFNRRVIETMKVNFLVSPEAGDKKDSLKQRDSGLNHVSAKAAAKNNISIIINFSEINSITDKKQKAIILARIMQNIKICRKANCKIKITTFAENPSQIVDEYSLKSFLFSLGASSQQVAEATQF